MRLELTPTDRGFRRADFLDGNGDPCSIQESSADRPMLWLGMNQGTHIDRHCLSRMHLTQEMAAALIPFLQYFVATGELPKRQHPADLVELAEREAAFELAEKRGASPSGSMEIR